MITTMTRRRMKTKSTLRAFHLYSRGMGVVYWYVWGYVYSSPQKPEGYTRGMVYQYWQYRYGISSTRHAGQSYRRASATGQVGYTPAS